MASRRMTLPLVGAAAAALTATETRAVTRALLDGVQLTTRS